MFLSPAEVAVLTSCEQDRTIAEVQADLEPEFGPREVKHAFRFLHRSHLLEDDESAVSPHCLFRQSAIGALFVRRQRTRAERVSPGGLRLVVG